MTKVKESLWDLRLEPYAALSIRIIVPKGPLVGR
jgi:hypothetical protein